MARNIPGTTRGSNCMYFADDEISNLKVCPQVVRCSELTPSHTNYLAAQIAADKQLDPVWIRKQANGEPELFEGRHRREAILQINDHLEGYGLEKPMRLWAIFHDMDDEQVISASFQGNDKLPMTVVDMAHAIVHMSDTLEWDGRHIAEVLSSPHRKLTPTIVSRLKLIHRLPGKIKTALHLGEITKQAAFLIIGTGGDNEELLETFRQLTAGEMSRAELSAKVTGKKREEGKMVKRTMGEFTALLGAVAGDKSATMLRWMEGHEDVAGGVLEIFRPTGSCDPTIPQSTPWTPTLLDPDDELLPSPEALNEAATSVEVEVGDEPQG